MKKLLLTLLISGLLAGAAVAAEGQTPCPNQCACDSSQIQGDGSTFKPLFPEYEAQIPLGG